MVNWRETYVTEGNMDSAGRVLPARREDLFILPCGNECVVHNSRAGEIHTLNEIAALIFGHCDGITEISALGARVGEEYGVPVEQFVRDLDEILRDFRDRDLLA